MLFFLLLVTALSSGPPDTILCFAKIFTSLFIVRLLISLIREKGLSRFVLMHKICCVKLFCRSSQLYERLKLSINPMLIVI